MRFTAEFPALALSRNFAFTSSVSGWDGQAAVPSTGDQCRMVYGSLAGALAGAGLSTESVVRLDHFTASQAWLQERQQVRAEYFGRPARLASTGVAVPQPSGIALSAAAIASRSPLIRLAIPGSDYGMNAIAAAVESSGYLFVSGILKTTQFARENLAATIADIRQIVERAMPRCVPVRFDIHAMDKAICGEAIPALRQAFGDRGAIRWCAASFDPPAGIEITSLFRQPDRGGLRAMRPLGGGISAITEHITQVHLHERERGRILARIDITHPPAVAGPASVLRHHLAQDIQPACVLIPASQDDDWTVSGFSDDAADQPEQGRAKNPLRKTLAIMRKQ